MRRRCRVRAGAGIRRTDRVTEQRGAVRGPARVPFVAQIRHARLRAHPEDLSTLSCSVLHLCRRRRYRRRESWRACRPRKLRATHGSPPESSRGSGHSAVGHQRHAKATALQNAERRCQLVQLGHSVRAWSLETDDSDEIAIEFAVPECRLHIVLVVEDDRRRLDDQAIGRDGRYLDRGRADVAAEHAQSAVAAKRI